MVILLLLENITDKVGTGKSDEEMRGRKVRKQNEDRYSSVRTRLSVYLFDVWLCPVGNSERPVRLEGGAEDLEILKCLNLQGDEAEEGAEQGMSSGTSS